MKNLLFTLSLVASSLIMVSAQQAKDCSTSMELCESMSYDIAYSEGIGEIDSDVAMSCQPMEYDSQWFTWRVQGSGMITFDIIPDKEDQDLDFTIYRLNNAEDCDDKTIVRCMASGETASLPSLECMGTTGLSIDDTDLEELAGCQDGNNNYLAALMVEADEQYVMLVNNFSQNGYGYTIDFESTAMLYCLIGVNTNELSTEAIAISPTISSGDFNVEWTHQATSLPTLQVYNLQGQLVHQQPLDSNNTSLQLYHLADGMYTVRLDHGATCTTHRIVIAK